MSKYRFAFVSNSKEVGEAVVAYSDPTTEVVNLNLASMERAVPVARQLLDEGVEVIIGGGGTGNLLAESIGQPVVKIDRSPVDMLPTLLSAREQSRHVAVTVFSRRVEGLDVLARLLDIEIQQVVFSSTGELERGIRLAIENGAKIVVGGGVCMQIAARHGVNTIIVIPQKENVLQTLHEARAVAAARRKDRRQFEELRTILHTVREGIIVVDSLRRVKIFNPTAAEILSSTIPRKQINALTGERLPAALDAIGFSRVLDTGNSEADRLLRIGNLSLIVSTLPIMVDDQLVGAICSIRESSRIRTLERKLREDLYHRGLVAHYTFDDLLQGSPSLTAIVGDAMKYAATEAAILIEGETGTGKELLAQAIHNGSSRADKPFLAINCSSLPESLLESELFGYEEGAFTGARRGGKAGLFELAHTGTLFLDEIVDIPPSMQVRLLRAIERNEIMRIGGDRIVSVDVRIVSSAQRNLFQESRKGKFRSDLFFRLATLKLRLPPLRERIQDLAALLTTLFEKHGRKIDPRDFKGLAQAMSYSWPGNIRELEATVHTYLALWPNADFSLAEYVKIVADRMQADDETIGQKQPEAREHSASLKEQLSMHEARIISGALQICSNNRTEAAKRLGISVNSLWRKSKQQ
jgi:propionate catabolism operon transcriptional regulator